MDKLPINWQEQFFDFSKFGYSNALDCSDINRPESLAFCVNAKLNKHIDQNHISKKEPIKSSSCLESKSLSQPNYSNVKEMKIPSPDSQNNEVKLYPLHSVTGDVVTWKFHEPIIIQGVDEFQLAACIDIYQRQQVEVLAVVGQGLDILEINNVPAFNLVEDAINSVGRIVTSIICTEPYQALDAALEAIASGLKQLIIETPHCPPLDTIKLLKAAKENQVLVLGPGSFGIIKPQQFCLGTLQSKVFQAGRVGVVGYKKALIYEVAWALNQAKIGQSWGISLGQDKVLGLEALFWLRMLNQDPDTDAIVLIQQAQDIDFQVFESLKEFINKPIICYVAGLKTPADKFFRNSTDILFNHLSNSIPAANSSKKIISMIKKAGLIIADRPAMIPSIVVKALKTQDQLNA